MWIAISPWDWMFNAESMASLSHLAHSFVPPGSEEVGYAGGLGEKEGRQGTPWWQGKGRVWDSPPHPGPLHTQVATASSELVMGVIQFGNLPLPSRGSADVISRPRLSLAALFWIHSLCSAVPVLGSLCVPCPHREYQGHISTRSHDNPPLVKPKSHFRVNYNSSAFKNLYSYWSSLPSFLWS